jgi:hypothetical protein
VRYGLLMYAICCPGVLVYYACIVMYYIVLLYRVVFYSIARYLVLYCPVGLHRFSVRTINQTYRTADVHALLGTN